MAPRARTAGPKPWEVRVAIPRANAAWNAFVIAATGASARVIKSLREDPYSATALRWDLGQFQWNGQRYPQRTLVAGENGVNRRLGVIILEDQHLVIITTVAHYDPASSV